MASRTFSSFALDGKPQVKTFAVNIGHSVAFFRNANALLLALSHSQRWVNKRGSGEEIQPWRELTTETSLERARARLS